MRPPRISLVFSLVALVALGSLAHGDAHAEMYRWVDQSGRVHWSDTPRAGAQKKSNDSTSLTGVYNGGEPRADGVRYAGSSPARPLRLEFPIAIELEGPDGGTRMIGEKRYGPRCDRSAGKITVPTRSIIDGTPLTDMARSFRRIATSLGYQLDPLQNDNGAPASIAPSQQTTALGPLQLSSTITDVEFDVCVPAVSRTRGDAYTRSSAKMTVTWTAREVATGQAIYETTTRGAHRDGTLRHTDDALDAIVRAYANAAERLFSDSAFTNLLDPANQETQQLAAANRRVLSSTRLPPLDIRYSEGVGFFKTFAFEHLRRSTVTVKAGRGQGSGFLLAGQRYVLTNWHVVRGSQDDLRVEFGERSGIKATIVRADVDRDVALLELDSNAPSQPLELATSRPSVGEVIYVIGTPLDDSLRQSVTRGIVSAHRTMEGLDYFQTDAAISPGNSGGPAFNERGEVVGIAVAGIFSRAGGSMNINYLIPIDDALTKMSVVAARRP